MIIIIKKDLIYTRSFLLVSTLSELFFKDKVENQSVGRTSPMNNTKSTVSVKVIRQIAQSYFGTGPYDFNTAQDHIARPLRLDPKDMFNLRPNLRSRSISLLLPFRQLAVTGAFPLKMFPLSLFFQPANCILRNDRPSRPIHHGWYCRDQSVLQKYCCHAHRRLSPGISE